VHFLIKSTKTDAHKAIFGLSNVLTVAVAMIYKMASIENISCKKSSISYHNSMQPTKQTKQSYPLRSDRKFSLLHALKLKGSTKADILKKILTFWSLLLESY